MSDMASERITVRVPATLGSRVRVQSRGLGQTPSEVVRVALESYLDKPKSTYSAYDAAHAFGLIGCVRRAPKDLSSNRRYFDGFGKGR